MQWVLSLTALAFSFSYLSFAFKSGSVFLEMLGVFDIMTCTMVIPFEVYGILKIETVNVPGGACIMLSILDSWICFSTLISVLAASIYILGRCTHHELPDVKRKNWSHSVGAIMLLIPCSWLPSCGWPDPTALNSTKDQRTLPNRR